MVSMQHYLCGALTFLFSCICLAPSSDVFLPNQDLRLFSMLYILPSSACSINRSRVIISFIVFAMVILMYSASTKKESPLGRCRAIGFAAPNGMNGVVGLLPKRILVSVFRRFCLCHLITRLISNGPCFVLPKSR